MVCLFAFRRAERLYNRKYMYIMAREACQKGRSAVAFLQVGCPRVSKAMSPPRLRQRPRDVIYLA